MRHLAHALCFGMLRHPPGVSQHAKARGMRGHEDFQQKAMLLYGPTHLAGFGTAAFGKLAVLKIAFWDFSFLGISGSLVSKFKLGVSKLSIIRYLFFYF